MPMKTQNFVFFLYLYCEVIAIFQNLAMIPLLVRVFNTQDFFTATMWLVSRSLEQISCSIFLSTRARLKPMYIWDISFLSFAYFQNMIYSFSFIILYFG